MKIKSFFITFIFILSSNPLFSQNYTIQPYDMILSRDAILEDLHFLSLVTGNAFLSFSPPLSPDEVRNFLESIDESSLSQSAFDAYNRILARLSPVAPLSFSKSNFTVLFNISSVIEGKIKTDNDISWFPQYPQIESFLALPVRLYFSDHFQLYFEPNITLKPGGYSEKIYDINFPFDLADNYMPIRSFAAFGGSWWNFQIGRDRLSWGSAYMGDLIFSDNSTYYDFARFSVFTPFIKYSVIVNQMPLSLTSNLMSEAHPYYDFENGESTMHRYYYLHRLDFTLFGKLNFALMEGVMIGNSQIELRYLNPILLFHSLYAWDDYEKPTKKQWKASSMVGSILSLEINWNITRSVSLFAHAVMNQLALPGEIDFNPDQPPNGFGYLAGVHYARSFNEWAGVFYFEAAYTDPYLNLSSSPYGSFILQNHKRFFFTGLPRDTFSLELGCNFFKADVLSLSGNFSWVSSGSHNEKGVKWDWEQSYAAYKERTPTGPVENTFALSLAARWRPYSFLVLNAGVTGIISANNNYSGRNRAGAQAQFSVGFNY